LGLKGKEAHWTKKCRERMQTVPPCAIEQWAPLNATHRGSVHGSVRHALTLKSDGQPINASTIDAYVGKCSIENEKKLWISQRIGPFVSTGGFDWWFFKSTNFLELTADDKVVATSFMGADQNGHPILYPPLHSHHTHVVPLGNNVNRAVMLEQHGDWITKETECLPSCSAVTPLLPNYFNVTGPLQMTAAMNDVRAQGSPPLTWYYQASVLISRAEVTGSALSKHYIWSPAAPGAPFGTFFVPCSHESFMVYHGTMPLAGTSVLFSFHAHMSSFQSAFLFGVSPEILKVPIPDKVWKPFAPAQLGLTTNFQVQQLIMKQDLAKSSLICSALARRIVFESAVYDRHAQIRCAKWTFNCGTPFTVITFNGPLAKAACGAHNVTQHAHWWLTYVAEDMHSHYTESLTQVMTHIVSSSTSGQPFGREGLQISFLLSGVMLFALFLKKSRGAASHLL